MLGLCVVGTPTRDRPHMWHAHVSHVPNMEHEQTSQNAMMLQLSNIRYGWVTRMVSTTYVIVMHTVSVQVKRLLTCPISRISNFMSPCVR